jgi:hypothetical protein
MRVTGTVAALPTGHMAEPEPLQVYVPRQRHFDLGEDDVLLRIAGDPEDVLARVREEVRALAPNLPVLAAAFEDASIRAAMTITLSTPLSAALRGVLPSARSRSGAR